MATWKKVIVSGSDAELNSLQVSGVLGVTGSLASTSFSGSFSGSFEGNGSNLTDLASANLDNNTISGVSLGSNLASLTELTNGGVNLSGDYNGSTARTINLDLNDLSAAVVNVANDSIAIIDADDSNNTKKESISDFISSIAGTGLTANNGQLDADNTGDITDVNAGDGISVAGSSGPTPTVSLNTGSNHFITGSRGTISVADTTGANGINLTYNTAGNGELSGVLAASAITIAGASTSLGGSITQATILEGSSAVTASGQLDTISPSGPIRFGQGSATYNPLGGNNRTISLAINSASAETPSTSDEILFGDTGDDNAVKKSTIGDIFALKTFVSGSGQIDINSTDGTLNVNKGGTGATSLTANKVLTGNDTNAVVAESNLDFDGSTLTVTGNAVITNDLTVQGTASFQQTENLQVADRFILLASGSNTAGDGGFVIQQGTQDVGELFGFENSVTRWGFTSSFTADGSSFTADAFVASVVEGGSNENDPTAVIDRYTKKGNLFVADNEDIYIYS